METTTNIFSELTHQQRSTLFDMLFSATHACRKLESFCSYYERITPVLDVQLDCSQLLDEINAADGIYSQSPCDRF